jgi:hypothetical protein
MADLNASDGASGANEHGVLANLPRTRPQRSTPRRTASRAGGRAATPPATRARGNSSAPPSKRATRARSAASAKTAQRRQQAAPVQGFDCEGEATGSVQPPGAVELISSVAEVVSELTKAGVSRSERLLKDLLARLPLS